MSTTTLPISNFINVSISEPPVGLAEFAVNNILILTREVPVNGSLGSYGVYQTPGQVASDWGNTSEVYQMAILIFAQSPNILSANGQLLIAQLGGSETLQAGIARLQPLVFFGGVLWAGYAEIDANIIAAAQLVQSIPCILFAPDSNTASVQGGGVLAQIQLDSLTYTQGLLYTLGAQQARFMAAAYAGLAMSTNWDGSNTAQTMHGKDLAGIAPDTGITQTLLSQCITAGADVYTTFGPLPKVYSTGGNTYFDQKFGLLWLQYALEVAGFNAIATTPTKLPQTEPGMALLKNAYIAVLTQGVNNGFLAPGAWNSSELFGDPVALVRNILQIGWYIFSFPVNQQSEANRIAREAPLVQIAAKLAGAIQSSTVIVFVNP